MCLLRNFLMGFFRFIISGSNNIPFIEICIISEICISWFNFVCIIVIGMILRLRIVNWSFIKMWLRRLVASLVRSFVSFLTRWNYLRKSSFYIWVCVGRSESLVIFWSIIHRLWMITGHLWSWCKILWLLINRSLTLIFGYLWCSILLRSNLLNRHLWLLIDWSNLLLNRLLVCTGSRNRLLITLWHFGLRLVH